MNDATRTVLIVEDEPDVRLYLRTALEDAGFNVLTAVDGEQGLELVRREKPDLISLDLMLPKKSGPRIFHEIKRDQELANIPILIVTAHAKSGEMRGDLAAMLESSTMSGPGGYLEKPVKASAYVQAVRRALGMPEVATDGDKVSLKEELSELMRKADPEALRKALEALKDK
ncbi:response regulator [Candidatus Sumerlaeota bacterium]